MATATQTTLPTISEQPFRRKIAAILAADVAGYSRLVAEAEEATLHALASAREIFDGLVRQGGGRIFNTAGDSVMCEFDSAVEAVRIAIDIQTSMAARNATVPPNRRLEFRMGLTIGDVVERGGDLLGDGVNIAARLEGLSPPGGLCVSRSVHEAVANKIAVGFRDIGERQVKNMPQAIWAYVVDPPKAAAAEPAVAHPPEAMFEGIGPAGRRPPLQEGAAGGRVAAALLALALLGGGAWYGYAPAQKWLSARSTIPSNLAATDPADRGRAVAPTSGVSTGASTPQGAGNGASPSGAIRGEPPAPTAPTAPTAIVPKAASAKPAVRTAEKGPERPLDKPFSAAEQPAAFAALARENVIADASTPAELYHNARLQEARGERPAALRSYASLVARSGEFLDADLRYAGLARASGAAATGRTVLADASRSAKTQALPLAAAALAEPAERRSRLESIAAANPDYAPAAYLLAEDYLTGTPTLTERRLAYDALGTFIDGASSAATEAAFLDRQILSGWRETARRRQGEIEASFAGAQTRPSTTFARAETGWLGTLTLPEPALAATVRIGERGEPRPVAGLGEADGRSKPASRLTFDIPGAQGRATLYVTYTDLSGHVAGPFPVAFDPTAALVSSEREALERFPDSWVAFRPDIPDVVSYRQLVSNRCAITRAMIGFGDGAPKVALALPPCNETNPYAIADDTRAVMTIPETADQVQVQLTYADGTQSAVRTFSRQ